MTTVSSALENLGSELRQQLEIRHSAFQQEVKCIEIEARFKRFATSGPLIRQLMLAFFYAAKLQADDAETAVRKYWCACTWQEVLDSKDNLRALVVPVLENSLQAEHAYCERIAFSLDGFVGSSRELSKIFRVSMEDTLRVCVAQLETVVVELTIAAENENGDAAGVRLRKVEGGNDG